jgi:hypothetical protein
MFQFYISYWFYIVSLCLGCGWYVLGVDARLYAEAGLNREAKLSRLLGWIHIAAGLLILAVQMITGMFE